MARSPSTQYPILGLLCIKPLSGYDLRAEIEGTLSSFWRESDGQIYPTLRMLEETGQIVRIEGRRKQARERQVYAITDLGRQHLRAWIAEEPRTQSPRNEFLLKVWMMRHGPEGAVLAHIRQHRQQVAVRMAATAELQKLVERNKSLPDFPVWQTLFRYGVLMREAELAWCDETLAALEPLERKDAKAATGSRKRTNLRKQR
jgi:PadR family transcriptional regulator, regulatory protein AphA